MGHKGKNNGKEKLRMLTFKWLKLKKKKKDMLGFRMWIIIL